MLRKSVLLAICAFGVCTPALAQSSVTLYGVLDSGITFTSHTTGGSVTALQSGVSMPERWGLTGREDIGGGNFVLFRLENQFQSSDGTLPSPGELFGLQSYVGVGGTWGTLTMGRQYDFAGDTLAGFALAANTPAGLLAWSLPAYAAGGGALDNRIWGIPTNNSVKYVSPSFNGFTAGAMWGFGNQAGSLARDSVQSYQLAYDGGGAFSAALVYFGQHDVLSAGNVYEFAASAAYGFSTFRAFGTVSSVHASDATPRRATTYEIGLTDYVTPTLQFGGGAQYQIRSDGLKDAFQFTLTVDYFLSKRTDVYAVAALGRDRQYGAQVEAELGSAGSMTQAAVRVGVRHSF